MTYSDILEEMGRHGMNEFCIERYEVETIAPNKYLIHIIFDGKKKKMYLTALATDIIESHTFESFSAFGGYDSKKIMEYRGPIIKLGLETSIDFTIYIGAVKVTVVQNETNYEIQVYSKQSISKVSLNTTTLTEDTTNTEPLTKKYNVTESPSGKTLTVTLMNETSINFTINL